MNLEHSTPHSSPNTSETPASGFEAVYRAMMDVRHSTAGTMEAAISISKVFDGINALTDPRDRIITTKQIAQAARPNSLLEKQLVERWVQLIDSIKNKEIRLYYAESALENTRRGSELDNAIRNVLRAVRPLCTTNKSQARGRIIHKQL